MVNPVEKKSGKQGKIVSQAYRNNQLRQVSESERSPIFVVGAPRSGTTLTATILGQHPDIYSPGETHYFEDVWSRRASFGDLVDERSLSRVAGRLMTLFGRFSFPETQMLVDTIMDEKALVERASSLGGGYGAMYIAFTSFLIETSGKRRICDDTPKHLYYLPAIFSLFPSSKAVVCIRDPRDFLCSYKNYWRRSAEPDRLRLLYHPIITSLLWRSSANVALRYASEFGQEKVLILRYEQLVNSPSNEVRRLCDFLGIDYSDRLTDVEANNSSFSDVSEGVFTTSVGRWRSELGTEELWWIQKLAAKQMTYCGYDAASASPSVWVLLNNSVTAPIALIRALRANRMKTGPTLSYVWRRISALAEN